MKKINELLEKPYAVLFVMVVAPLLGFIDRNFVFFFALGIVFLILKKNQYNFEKVGMGKKITKKTVFKSVLMAGIMVFFFSVLDPIIEHYLGKTDLSALAEIKHNFGAYFVLMLIMWVFAAFGEEILFRGYYMKGLAFLLGNSTKAWIVSGLITSLYFGISHIYQGWAGVVSVTLFSLLFSYLFFRNKNNLWLLILIHGIYDSVFITLLYLDQKLLTTHWIELFLNPN